MFTTKNDFLNSFNEYKALNCPKISNLNKKQLGILARKIGLEVVSTGNKNRPDGINKEGSNNYPKRTKTTWKNIRNRDLDRIIDKKRNTKRKNI